MRTYREHFDGVYTILESEGCRIQILEGVDRMDENSDSVDVEVILADGRRFVSTFQTLAFIQGQLDRDVNERGGVANSYFYCADLIIVSRLTAGAIFDAVSHLIQSGDLGVAFSEVPPDAEPRAPV